MLDPSIQGFSPYRAGLLGTPAADAPIVGRLNAGGTRSEASHQKATAKNI